MKKKVSHYVARNISRKREDFLMTTFRGSGPGGQNRNKVNTGVRITDKITGIYAEATDSRSQEQNKRAAFLKLVDKLIKHYHREETKDIVAKVESGKRYVRTYNAFDNYAKDHITEKKYDLKDTLDGNLEPIMKDKGWV